MKYFLLIFAAFSVFASDNPLRSPDLIARFGERLDQMDNSFKVLSVTTLKEDRQCVEQKVVLSGVDPIDGKVQNITLLRYLPKSADGKLEKKYKTELLIHPPTKLPAGGSTPFDRWYGRRFCKSSVRSTIMETWDGYLEEGVFDFGTHDRAAVRAIHVSRMAIAHANAPFVVMGTSLGSIYSSTLLGLEPEIKGGVLIVGGAPLVEVLKTTDERFTAGMRDQRMKNSPKEIPDADTYEKILEENVRISPEKYIDRSKTSHLQMYLAKRDTTVPTHTQFELWKAWGKPFHRQYEHNHLNTVIETFLTRRGKIHSFLMNEIIANETR